MLLKGMQRYQEDLEENRAAKMQKYEDNSATIKASEKSWYWNDPDAVRLAKRTPYHRLYTNLLIYDYDGSCDFVVGGDTGLQVVCTHTCDTTYQYKTSTIGWPSPVRW